MPAKVKELKQVLDNWKKNVNAEEPDRAVEKSKAE